MNYIEAKEFIKSCKILSGIHTSTFSALIVRSNDGRTFKWYDSHLEFPEDQWSLNEVSAEDVVSDERLKEIWRRVATREMMHGDFLTSFGQTVVRADSESFGALRDIALALCAKYKLDEEAKRQDELGRVAQ